MRPQPGVSWFRRVLQNFATSNRGNVALGFGLAMVPIIGLSGAAVDYSRANSVKAAFQSALDATALRLSKEAATENAGQLQSNALNYFNALFTRPEATGVAIDVAYTNSGGSQVVINGSASVATSFMKIFGYDSVTVNGIAAAKWGASRLRVALVLDNTGSMADYNKIGALKTATNGLLSQLQSAGSVSGDVYVSIVPFVKDVNLGAGNYDAPWIDWTEWDAANGTCSKTSYSSSQKTCEAHAGTWTSAAHQTWNGCVVDRGNKNAPDPANYDTNIVAPVSGNTATQFAAEQYVNCPQTSMGLGDNWSMMTTLVNSMSPAGNTNQGIGLALGWMSLTGGGPFTAPPLDPNYKYQTVIILLTDGLNTQNRWYSSASSIDAREKMTCDNIKAADITLYTVQVNTDGDPTSALLKNCASSSDKFFLLTSADQMVTAFNAIGTNLSKLFLAQ